MEIKIINKSNNPNPEYATEGSAGLDLKANLSKEVIILPGERILIPIDISIQLPKGYEAQIRPRSGNAIKKGLTVLNTPGTIDSDYIGNISVILYNADKNNSILIKSGDKIAQMVISKYEKIEWKSSKKLEQTERGEKGFGHTDKT